MSQLWNFAKASRFIDVAASRLIDRGNIARDNKIYPEAAALYEQALAMIPDDAAIHIQCGHMFKESGVLPKAEEHYKRAYELTPDDAPQAAGASAQCAPGRNDRTGQSGTGSDAQTV